MKIISIACSRRGNELQERTREWFCKKNPKVEWNTVVKTKALKELSIQESIEAFVEREFSRVDGIIFFAAAGIAVRSIAGCVSHKAKDPAVIVVDETGKYCIPILSGHMGGANALAAELAKGMGAIPVITTATDCEGKFAVDEFARKNQLLLKDWKQAKDISAGLLLGETLQLKSELVLVGIPPKEVLVVDSFREQAGCCGKVLLSNRREQNGVLQLIPRNVIVGLGCRKGVPIGCIEAAVEQALMEAGIKREAIGLLVSVDQKKEEPGILEFCEKNHISFCTYSAEELNRVTGEFEGSSFVQKVIGVDNVCERSAALAGDRIIYKKKAFQNVTVALAIKEMRIEF